MEINFSSFVDILPFSFMLASIACLFILSFGGGKK